MGWGETKPNISAKQFNLGACGTKIPCIDKWFIYLDHLISE